MSLAIDVELLTGTYEAGVGGERPEWPPHPARVFCALVAQARSERERDALRWLERQPPPSILASEASASLLRGFVPTNGIPPRGRRSTYLARTNGARTWPRALPTIGSFRLEWEDAAVSDEVLGDLRALAARVAYVGRPAGMTVARVSRDPALGLGGCQRLIPAESGPHLLRVPYPGYLDALIGAYDAGEPADSVSLAWPYAARGGGRGMVSGALPGPYDRLFVLSFPPGAGIAGWHATRVASALRDATLSRLGRPRSGDPWRPFAAEELAAIHGHGERLPPQRRCAFLALPFVGHRHATGEVIGVGIAIGREIDPELRRALLQLLGLDRDEGPRLTELSIPGLGVTLPLGPPDGRWSIEPVRWVGPARRWASALPVVLDRWPKRRGDVAVILREGVQLAGYPEPGEIEVLRGSAVAGAPLLRPGDRKRRASDPDRSWSHVLVTFAEPVQGPVLLGHLRFVGLGLCAPVSPDG